MKHTEPVRKNRCFRRIYNKGASIANRLLVMVTLARNDDTNRLGVSVGKKVGNAVVRNKVKRRIKESYRGLEHRVKRGRDVVIIARGPCRDATYWEIDEAIVRLLGKHGLLCREEPPNAT